MKVVIIMIKQVLDNTKLENQERSRIGLSFIFGIIGAYFFSKSLTNFAHYVGLLEVMSSTNTGYLMSILAGLITGIGVVIIAQDHKLKTLIFVIGSLCTMDVVAYISTAMPINDLINRMLVTLALSTSGLSSYLIFKFFIWPRKKQIS